MVQSLAPLRLGDLTVVLAVTAESLGGCSGGGSGVLRDSGAESAVVPVLPQAGQYKHVEGGNSVPPLWIFSDAKWLLEEIASDFRFAIQGEWRFEKAPPLLLPAAPQDDLLWVIAKLTGDERHRDYGRA